MSRLKFLNGKSLLDRHIGRSTFEYSRAIKLPASPPVQYAGFVGALEEQSKSLRNPLLWRIVTPFGRSDYDRINLGSCRKVIRLYGEEDNENTKKGENEDMLMEIYEYSVGYIRPTIFSLIPFPAFLQQQFHKLQFLVTSFLFDKLGSGRLLSQIGYRNNMTKNLTKDNFTSSEGNYFAKWNSSIYLIKVLHTPKKSQETQQAECKEQYVVLSTRCLVPWSDDNKYQPLLMRVYHRFVKYICYGPYWHMFITPLSRYGDNMLQQLHTKMCELDKENQRKQTVPKPTTHTIKRQRKNPKH
ncbi:hypothetical protein RFI_18520 [Reticulomyxa filosa]|uniref:Uncharacterized protein n=1 Tax=Reticulomyxa filosa TaxID=46433 RepID=X6MYM6_RETFI|nr:hypothetical protein RFI_18520 [Reticulomyxa filosa]|eukprot:ETO18738.1 hypothetical protein RFI_18520 [Reticulomyxa filosa]